MTLYETAKTLYETWRSKLSEPTYCGDWVTLTNDERRAWEATAMAAMQCADVNLAAELAAVYDVAFEAGEVEVKPAADKVRAIIDSRNDLCDRLDIINGAYETECARSDRYRKALVFIKQALADETIANNPRECEIDNVVRKALL